MYVRRGLPRDNISTMEDKKMKLGPVTADVCFFENGKPRGFRLARRSGFEFKDTLRMGAFHQELAAIYPGIKISSVGDVYVTYKNS